MQPAIENDWWAATDPEVLIDWLFFDALAANRKLRLFCVAVVRRVQHLVKGTEFFPLLDVSEAFADGLIAVEELLAPYRHAKANYDVIYPTGRSIDHSELPLMWARLACLHATHWNDISREECRQRNLRPAEWAVSTHTWAVAGFLSKGKTAQVIRRMRRNEHRRQLRLLHDLFGPLPFREIAVDPSWLTADVLAVARAVYDEMAFDRMAILADALQDAGCDNAEMLNHCRAERWKHSRGCWVVDRVLGRPWQAPRPS